jgi:hypothetical protein
MGTTVKKLLLALAFGLVACAIPSMAFAVGLGLNFAADEVAPTGSALAPGDVAGAVPQANWNNLTGADGMNVGDLERDNGAASTATVTWSSNNTWASLREGEMNNNFTGPDRNLMTGYLDSGDTVATATSVTVDNIDAAVRIPNYDVLVYMANGSQVTRGGGFTLTSGGSSQVKYGSTSGPGPSMHVLDPGTDIDNTLHGSYLRFTGLSAPSFTLTADATLTTPNGFRATIAAIQIVGIPEPASAILACGAALVAMIGWRRRQR